MRTFPKEFVCTIALGVLLFACGETQKVVVPPPAPVNAGWVTANRIFVPDYGHNDVRVANRVTGIITTAIPTSAGGTSVDGTDVGSAQVNRPTHAVAVDDTHWAFANISAYCVQAVASDKIKKIAGTCGTAGSNGDGDGGLAVVAKLDGVGAFCNDVSGNVYLADASDYRVRRVDVKTGLITTVVGNGTYAVYNSANDGKAATDVPVQPSFCATDKAGNLFVSDPNNKVIYKIDTKGKLTTFAGTGTAGSFGDGGQANIAQLNIPQALTIDRERALLYFIDRDNDVVRRIDLSTGVITRFAGTTGVFGFSGDGGQAAAAQLAHPQNLALSPTGELFIAENQRIRRVNLDGNISTVVGDGTASSGGDGGQAASAQVQQPLAYDDWWN